MISHQCKKIRSPSEIVEEKEMTKKTHAEMVGIEKEEEKTNEESQDSVPVVRIRPPSMTEPEPVLESHKEKNAPRKIITRPVSVATY